jgi:hypothetical protein
MDTEMLNCLDDLRTELRNDRLIYSVAEEEFGIDDPDQYEVEDLVEMCVAVEYRNAWI